MRARSWRGSCGASLPIAARLHFELQLHTKALAHGAPGQRDQRDDIACGGPTGVDDEVGVDRRNPRLAAGGALEAHRLDQPARKVTGRILEDRSRAGLWRLGLFAVLAIRGDAGLHLVYGSAAQ